MIVFFNLFIITEFEDKIEQYSLLLEDDNKVDKEIDKIKNVLNLKKFYHNLMKKCLKH